MSVSQDGSESVDQFLARIASVKESRGQVNEERTRRMEEDYIKNRKERQARRLERARSLSPAKTGPSATSTFSQSPATNRETVLNPPVDFSPRATTLSRSNAVSARTSPKLEPKQLEADPFLSTPNPPSPSTVASGLSRNGTLSWQQRPPREGGMGRPRPLSTIDTIRTVPKLQEQQDEGNTDRTRQEIAASLGSKDPAWFRQTQDRGLGSAALRKSQVEDTVTVEHSARSQILPGMSRDGTRSASSTPVRDTEPVPTSQNRQLSPPSNDRSQRNPSPIADVFSATPKLEPSVQQLSSTEPQTERIHKDLPNFDTARVARSPSPTKGLGGFVESAMMKRSDSVNKRWSVQANSGLKRGDSVAGVRPLSSIRPFQASSLSRTPNRDTSPGLPDTSRPGSRDGALQSTSISATPEKLTAPKETPKEIERPSAAEPVRPTTPPDAELSRSPSKTLDPKRWSPTKASWLESALLSKPEPPKPAQAKEEIPAWKATLQRNKASRDLSPDKIKEATKTDADTLKATPKKSTQPPIISKKPSMEDKASFAPVKKPVENQKDLDIDSPPVDETRSALSQTEKSSIKEVVTHQNVKSTDHTIKIADRIKEKTAEPSVLDKRPPPVLRPKPQTPPKTDFRATLRSRAAVSAEGNEAEPEFKSMFGKLKRTQTQNYVAPDVLKDNILTGKAGLSTTDGPQKSQRVDEFKESILQKKQNMKTSVQQKQDEPKFTSPPAEPTVPEALARRKTLHKASPSVTKLQESYNTSQNSFKEQLKPVVPTKSHTLPPKPSEKAMEDISSNELVLKKVSSLPPKPHTVGTKLEKQVLVPEDNKVQMPAGPELSSSAPAVLPKAELPTGSKLASRLNPSLATFLSRGGSPRPAPSKSPSPERQHSGTFSHRVAEVPAAESATGNELSHMTKGRAKGPKRRAPKSQPTLQDTTSEPRKIGNEVKTVVGNQPSANPRPAKSVSSLEETFGLPAAKSNVPVIKTIPISTSNEPTEEKEAKPVDSDNSSRLKMKPAVTAKSSELRRVSSTLSSHQTDSAVSKGPVLSTFEIAADTSPATQVEPRPLPRELPKTPKPTSTASPLTPSKSRINTPKLTPTSVSAPSKPQSPKPTSSLGLSMKTMPARSNPGTGELTPPPDRPLKPSTASKPQTRLSSDGNLASILPAYFSSTPSKQQRADFDAEGLLTRAKQPNEKIKSLSHNIWEIAGDGKKSAMPPQQEHILFEESMYLVAHTFSSGNGTRSTEVFLWCGDSVGDAAIEDAQLYCRKDARERNAKLEVIKQGKEPAGFFQALGGILIVRQNRSSSLYMLCGRRHLGHISFDEIELERSNLCSGFAYLISAKFGKLYLWKGKGTGADEVGCARLIGMDLGLTGEIEEVEEGKEPSSFWDSFPRERNVEKTSHDWQERAKHDCYPTTLYRVDLDRPKSAAGGFWGLTRAASPPKPSNKAAIEMISPFCHHDLEPSNVYVLDTYRSIYVILLDPEASARSTEVITALDLAQELAMLSPSVQDRSLIPSCFVSFGAPPADVKMCFRKWPDNPYKSGLGKTQRPSACVSLEAVMEALNL